jgi:hypothetical protein
MGNVEQLDRLAELHAEIRVAYRALAVAVADGTDPQHHERYVARLLAETESARRKYQTQGTDRWVSVNGPADG